MNALLLSLFEIFFQLILTPLFYGPGWLVCSATPFWRDGARALLREPFWDGTRRDRYNSGYSDAANAVAFIGFLAIIVTGGATYGAYLLLRG